VAAPLVAASRPAVGQKTVEALRQAQVMTWQLMVVVFGLSPSLLLSSLLSVCLLWCSMLPAGVLWAI
jgi:hypothetical protein